MNPISILLGAKAKIQVNFELAAETPSSRAEIRGYEYLRNGDTLRASKWFFEAIKKNPERTIRIADACMSARQGQLTEWVLKSGYYGEDADHTKKLQDIDQLDILSSLIFFQATGKLIQSKTHLSVSDILSVSKYKSYSESSSHAPDAISYSMACRLVSRALKKGPERAIIPIACLANLQNIFSRPFSHKVRYENIVPGLTRMENDDTICDSAKQHAKEILNFLGVKDKSIDQVDYSPQTSFFSEGYSTAMAKGIQPVKRK